LIPWFNIVFILILVVIVATIWRLWLNFRRARIDPALEDVGEGFDAAERRVGSLLDRVLGKKKG
jgi:membrane protein implicated in regulation of membrane protease activity